MTTLLAHSADKWIGLSVVVLVFGGGILIIALATRPLRKRQEQDRLSYHQNVERHRLHAERSEEHMKRLEAILERIADALEQRSG